MLRFLLSLLAASTRPAPVLSSPPPAEYNHHGPDLGYIDHRDPHDDHADRHEDTHHDRHDYHNDHHDDHHADHHDDWGCDYSWGED